MSSLAETVIIESPRHVDENVILGYKTGRPIADETLTIGPGAYLRSGTILYAGSTIGAGLETGHNVVIREENVRIGIIAVPEQVAQEVCNQMVEAGIRGIPNFAPLMLKTPPEVFVQNISVCNELEALIYMTEKPPKEKK